MRMIEVWRREDDENGSKRMKMNEEETIMNNDAEVASEDTATC